MTRSLEGSVAFVTGGARGIGRAICEQLTALGAAVAAADLDEGAARDAGRLGVRCDVADYDSVRAAIERVEQELGPIGVLVNNAGWDKVEPFLRNEPSLWDRLIDVNLRGAINTCHLVGARMSEGGSGRIINIASDAGRVGSSGEAVYSACKGGIIAFTKALARELARSGVRVNCVSPGPTDTPMLGEITADETGGRIIDAIVRATPTRRLAHPAEIAEAVAFFATASDHVTGQVLSVSGGLTMAD